MTETTAIIISIIITLIVIIYKLRLYYITKNRCGIDTINFSTITKTSCEFILCYNNDDVISGVCEYRLNNDTNSLMLQIDSIIHDGYISKNDYKKIETRLKYTLFNIYEKH